MVDDAIHGHLSADSKKIENGRKFSWINTMHRLLVQSLIEVDGSNGRIFLSGAKAAYDVSETSHPIDLQIPYEVGLVHAIWR